MDRNGALERLRKEAFDLLVIGGGITGAGVARDAALRGLRTALVERDDVASGTSSRSSRLIHGGVRYLEHGYLRLVFEASRERRTLLRIAPHLVRPLEFTWPVYRGARIPRWKLYAGLLLYDVLALFRNVGRHRRLSARGVLGREPALRPEGLLGGATYFDAATDDVRLTLANIIAAVEAGAVVVNHAEARQLIRDDGRSVGVRVADSLGGTELDVRAKAIVNAGGPWGDEVRRLEEPAASAGMRGTKGVHIAIPRDRIANQSAVTMVSPVDGRVMFVLPAGALTIVGTTDTATTSHPDQVRASRADVSYLLQSANAFFPGAALTEADVVSAWAGIRPLVAGKYRSGGHASSASREHAITVGPSGMLTVSGGKLTTYRSMAEEIVDRVEHVLGRRASPCLTAKSPLPTEADSGVAKTLGDALSAAEIVHAVRNQMACTLADLLIRRTRLAFETRDHGLSLAAAAAEVAAPLLGWDAAEVQRQVEAYRHEVERIFTVDDLSP